jgi:hypothetical protein
MALDVAHTTRGAIAGVVAAGVWAAQQPLDKRIFASSHDDTELLGKAVTRGKGWAPAGVALHLANGAAFGAMYANLGTRLPLPSWARGPVAALGEHVATWPLTALTDRLHPARHELPKIARSGRAFGQSTWRHLLFGVVLGEVERRLNGPKAVEIPSYEHVVSSNGHGKLDPLITGRAR